MRRPVRLIVGCGVLLVAALATAQPAMAHALAQSSVPAAGAVLNQAPTTVTITFGEAPDPKLSSIDVLDTSAASWTGGPTAGVPGDPTKLRVTLKALPHGVYTVTWRTVSAVDGHLASGSFAFGVGVALSAAQSSAGTTASPPPSALAVVARGLLFAGLMLALGVAVVALFVLPTPEVTFNRVLPAAAVLALLGAVLVTEAERSAAGIGWSAVLGSSLGSSLVERLGCALLLSAAAVALRTRGRPLLRRAALVAAAVAALAAMFVDVASSHAGAEQPVVVNELLQWVHIAAAGAWIGGLGALLLGIRGLPSAAKARGIRRFSVGAGISLAAVGLTGVVRAVLEIQTWHGLLATGFGQLVIIKTALLVVLICLGAVNRYRSVPRAALSLRGLRRVGSAEMVLATAAVLVAAALVNVAPPVAAQTTTVSRRAALIVTGSDQATTVRVRLSLSPGTPGFNTFLLTISDYDSGRPVTPATVKLSISSRDQPLIGGSTLTMTRTGPGAFSAHGANLSLGGRWRVAVLLEQGDASTEVDLQVTVTSPPPTIDVQHFGGGLPTLYRVHLTEGRALEVYVDPDKPGATHFHATFFGATGQELPISTVAIGAGSGRSTPVTLAAQRLDPGHFVANVTLPAGATHFTVVATTATGEQLATAVDLTPGSP